VLKYDYHILICTNKRSHLDRISCGAQESRRIFVKFNMEIDKHALFKNVKINTTNCMDMCTEGPNVVVYPGPIHYSGVTESDVLEIVEKHLIKNEIVTRLVHAENSPLST
jgi:(2Fe-2S) ferredoxin